MTMEILISFGTKNLATRLHKGMGKNIMKNCLFNDFPLKSKKEFMSFHLKMFIIYVSLIQIKKILQQ